MEKMKEYNTITRKYFERSRFSCRICSLSFFQHGPLKVNFVLAILLKAKNTLLNILSEESCIKLRQICYIEGYIFPFLRKFHKILIYGVFTLALSRTGPVLCRDFHIYWSRYASNDQSNDASNTSITIWPQGINYYWKHSCNKKVF